MRNNWRNTKNKDKQLSQAAESKPEPVKNEKPRRFSFLRKGHASLPHPSFVQKSLHTEYKEQLQSEIARMEILDENNETPTLEFDDLRAICYALHVSAGSPQHTDTLEFVEDDTSTWSLTNLHRLDTAAVLKLEKIAPEEYVRPKEHEKETVSIHSLRDAAPHLLPFHNYFFPQDKFNMNHSDGHLVAFDLDPKAFSHDTRDNKAAALESLLPHIAPSFYQFITLQVSPMHALTLPPHARTKANIPLDAAYFSFCNPLPHNLPLAELKSKFGVNPLDPFVLWLTVGAFVYFSHTYDIVAINAVSFDKTDDSTSLLWLGAPSPLPHLSESQLELFRRWRKVTSQSHIEQSFTHMTWIIPSEMLGNHIFTRSGGFAFRVANDRSLFYPVVPPTLKTKWELTEYSSPVHIPEFLNQHRTGGGSTSDVSGSAEVKWMSEQNELIFAHSTLAALGIEKILGITPNDILEFRNRGVAAIEEEFSHCEREEDRENFDYVYRKPAEKIQVVGNDGFLVWRDDGNEGKRLHDFCQFRDALTAELTEAEVLALRLYTSTSFYLINRPLRNRGREPQEKWCETRHPFAATVYFISSGLKKLRAVSLNQRSFEPLELWRGIKNKSVDSKFQEGGGAELACMSTTRDLHIVAKYARSSHPLMFKIRVESPMDMGADISWLSLFPHEKEILYPPLTFLKAIRVQPIKGVDGGAVVTVKPSFPS